MKQSISVSETQFQHHNKQTHCMNQRTQNAITIAAQHKDGDLVEVELAFRQAKMGQHEWITHSHKMIQTQWNYKSLSLASRQAELLQNLIHKSDDAPHKHTQGMG